MSQLLVDAWRRWDNAPRSEQTANSLEDVVQAVATHPTVFRARVAELRRSGVPLVAAIKEALTTRKPTREEAS